MTSYMIVVIAVCTSIVIAELSTLVWKKEAPSRKIEILKVLRH
uniref:Col_cuticle_N domain-containing protein n=1 Tax=Heterorhabditis bacteriophora TaxID=37862 RepID=A0A1I7WSI1_HETBA